MKTQSKQELRTQETQARLLTAAEEIFVRDGYEAAQLDEIASHAGRSKGAVYTHFSSKEDLFLALFEHRIRSYIERFMSSLERCQNQEESMAAFRKFYIGLVRDRAWSILMIEFKLFALRHPESEERLHKTFQMTKPPKDLAGDRRIFGQVTRAQRAENDAALVVLSPILAGLILESHFEPAILTEKSLERLLGAIFDAIFRVGIQDRVLPKKSNTHPQ